MRGDGQGQPGRGGAGRCFMSAKGVELINEELMNTLRAMGWVSSR